MFLLKSVHHSCPVAPTTIATNCYDRILWFVLLSFMEFFQPKLLQSAACYVIACIHIRRRQCVCIWWFHSKLIDRHRCAENFNWISFFNEISCTRLEYLIVFVSIQTTAGLRINFIVVVTNHLHADDKEANHLILFPFDAMPAHPMLWAMRIKIKCARHIDQLYRTMSSTITFMETTHFFRV